MTPSILALKILCQPHLMPVHFLEYLEQDQAQRATSEFRSETLKQLQDILAAVRTELDTSEYGTLPTANSPVTATAADSLAGVQTVIFSSEGLSGVLVGGRPLEIGAVILGSLARGESCRIPVGLAELEALEFSWEQDKLHIRFDTAYGRFWTDKGRDEYRPPQKTLVVSERSRKKYGGSLTIKGYGQDLGFQAAFSRRLKTMGSVPTLSIPNGRGLHMAFALGDEVLREVILLLLEA